MIALGCGFWFGVGRRERAETKSVGVLVVIVVVEAAVVSPVGIVLVRKGFGRVGAFPGCVGVGREGFGGGR